MINHTKKQNVLLSTLSKSGFSTIFIGFFFTILIVMFMTISMPTPLKTTHFNETCAPGSCLANKLSSGANFTSEIGPIHSAHQKVYLYLNFQMPEKRRIRMTVNSTILKSTTGATPTSMSQTSIVSTKSKKTKAFCDDDLNCELLITSIEASRKYSTVYVASNIVSLTDVTGLDNPYLRIVYTSVDYTSFEMFWRITFLTLICCCTIFFMFMLRSYPFLEWSIEQKATCILLVGLVIFNNPLYCYEFITANEFLPFLNSLLDSLLLSSILLYVLIIFDALRKPLSQRTFFKFYLSRFLVVIFLEGFVVNLYLCNIDTTDPLMVTMKDPVNATLAIFAAFSLFVYAFWLIFATIRSLSEARKLGEIGQRIRSYAGFTLAVFLVLVSLLLSNFIEGYKSNSAVYLTLIAYLDLYCLVLMIFYLPTQKKESEWSNNRRRIVLDEIKVTEYDDEDNELVIEEQLNDAEELAISNVTEEVMKDEEHIDL
ncbi:Transmembrane protein [Entamoeba marina]